MMACNILEHIPQDRFDAFVSALDSIVRPGACLAISVPYSYPLHLDPIDSYFRPSPDELALMFELMRRWCRKSLLAAPMRIFQLAVQGQAKNFHQSLYAIL